MLAAGLAGGTLSEPAVAETLLKSGQNWETSSRSLAGALVLKVKGKTEDVAVGPATISDAKAFLWVAKSSELRNLQVDDVKLTNLKQEGIRLDGDATGVSIENFDFSMRDAQDTDYPAGIILNSGTDILIRDGRLSGFRSPTAKGDYPQGDGVSAERGVSKLTITGVSASGNADGGYDLKSSETRLDDLRAEDNYRNYRLWGSVEAGRLESRNPRGAHLWAGKGADIRIAEFVVSSDTDAPILQIDGAKRVQIDHCVLSVPEGTSTVSGNASNAELILDESCKL
ncbi:hypothetical protein C725_0266 [Pacificimonas flava]|uniref:Uncharacterized protein n=1 Tax=Pacificimonas flava TaxID=1234595 RepID=M2TRE4_9SPHN|nr:hypothetical protein C725_0266 [Pacificimonas flava]